MFSALALVGCPHSLFASLRGLPKNFPRFLYGVGLFGAGDFAHSLMILYAVAAFTPKFGAARATTISVGLYALHNIVYAGISYPAGALADRINKRFLTHNLSVITYSHLSGFTIASRLRSYLR